MSESDVFGGRPGDGYSTTNNDVLLQPLSSIDDDEQHKVGNEIIDAPIVASESDLTQLFNTVHNRNNGNTTNDDDDDDDSSLGEDLIDLEGWNRRRNCDADDTDEEDDDDDETIDLYGVVKKKIGHLPIDDYEYNDTDDDIGVFGVVKKIFAIDDHDNNNKEEEEDDDDDNIRSSRNQRRGLFGGWGKNGTRHGRISGKENNNTVTTSTSYARLGDTLTYGVDSAVDDNNNSTTNNNTNVYENGDELIDDDDAINDEDEEEQRMDNRLRPGDHIFIWQTYGINLRAYQRHAVVYSVDKRGSTRHEDEAGGHSDQLYDGYADMPSFDLDSLYDPPEDDDSDVIVTVVSFYHLSNVSPRRDNTARGGNKRKGCKCESLLDFIGPDGLTRKKPVHKVRYGRAVKHGLLSSKAGVGTALKKDRIGLILARLRYLLDHPDDLPAHNALSANGECASLWSVTGRWCSLQGASILAVTSVGQAGGALVAGGILSQLTVLLPMPGLWGAAGWWWYVPATVAYPFLVPMLVTLGMASLLPLEILRRNRKKWRAITDGMNHDFWSLASDIIKEEYFGAMATAEREAEMRSFFGVREGDTSGVADDSRYMPLGVLEGSDGDDDNYNNREYDEYDDDDDNDDNEETEALAIQRMEKKCRDMNVNLSGRPPSSRPDRGAWGSFVGSFRKKESSLSARQLDDSFTETEILNTKN